MVDNKIKSYFSLYTKFLLMVFMCSVSSCKTPKTSIELENHFSKEQIKDLNKINDFFIEDIMNSSRNSFQKDFLKLVLKSHETGLFIEVNSSDFENPKKLLNSISKSTLNEIWEVKTTNTRTFILPKSKGKFQLYLKQLSSTNPFASDCIKQIKQRGEFSMLFFNSYIKNNFSQINFDYFNNQLIISVYFLSMVNDNIENSKKSKKEVIF